LLTPLTVDDADAMVGELADPALYTFIGGRPPTLEQLRQQYRRQAVGRSADGSQDWFNWIVRLRDTDEPIGTVQATILDDATRGEIAWIIGVPWQGNGFAPRGGGRAGSMATCATGGRPDRARPPRPRGLSGGRAGRGVGTHRRNA
jgi:RimJ/RimL family protein N-acetyltransferase